MDDALPEDPLPIPEWYDLLFSAKHIEVLVRHGCVHQLDVKNQVVQLLSVNPDAKETTKVWAVSKDQLKNFSIVEFDSFLKEMLFRTRKKPCTESSKENVVVEGDNALMDMWLTEIIKVAISEELQYGRDKGKHGWWAQEFPNEKIEHKIVAKLRQDDTRSVLTYMAMLFARDAFGSDCWHFIQNIDKTANDCTYSTWKESVRFLSEAYGCPDYVDEVDDSPLKEAYEDERSPRQYWEEELDAMA